MFRRIFISPAESRPRAGWRILLQTIMLGVFFCIVAFPVGWLGPGKSQTWTTLLLVISECFAITVSVIYARRFLDKRSFSSLGFEKKKTALLDLIAGLLISLIMVTSLFLAENSLLWISVERFAWEIAEVPNTTGQLLIWLVFLILVGWQEELLSRGYHLQNLAEGINQTWGVLLSSFAFAAFHSLNPGASYYSAVGIFLVGLLLSYAYISTRQLWLPISLHVGWNFFEGALYGFPVSGISTSSLFNLDITGPALWTGGEFGPEPGLIMLPVLLLGSALVYIYARRIRSQYA